MPEELIEPPPTPSTTLQVTWVWLVPVTVAENVFVPFAVTAADVGLIVTLTSPVITVTVAVADFAVSAMLNPAVAVSAAFLLGAFPTRSISTLARRFAKRALNLGPDVDEKTESELEQLQRVDTRIAERFADEGITTIVQLAYSDPVDLTMRCASFSFSFVVGCDSQALAWLYRGSTGQTAPLLAEGSPGDRESGVGA